MKAKKIMVKFMAGAIAVLGIVLSSGVGAQAAEGYGSLEYNASGELVYTISQAELQKAAQNLGVCIGESDLYVNFGPRGVVGEVVAQVDAMDTLSTAGLPDYIIPHRVGETLVAGQRVIVTGIDKATGAYMLQYDRTVGYVSPEYIVLKEGESVDVLWEEMYKSPDVSTDEIIQAALAEGKSVSSGVSPEFVNYLNQQRVAKGLKPLVWDETLAVKAQERARAVVSDFHHERSANLGYGENLYKGSSGDVADWYNGWYSSIGHSDAMLDSYAVSAACAYYEVGGQYFVSLLLHAESTPVDIDAMIESGEMVKIKSADEDGAADIYATKGAYVETDQQTIDAVRAAARAAGLIP